MAESKTYQFTINPVKNRTVYLWYKKVMEQEEEKDVLSAIVRHALESYYESGGKCTLIAQLHDRGIPSDAEPIRTNLYIGTGSAKKLLDTMKANKITKSKVIHAVLEGGIEFIPETEKEMLYLPAKKRSYKGVLSAMSDILHAKTDPHPVAPKREEDMPIKIQAKPAISETQTEEKLVTIIGNHPSGERKKKTVAALSGKRG